MKLTIDEFRNKSRNVATRNWRCFKERQMMEGRSHHKRRFISSDIAVEMSNSNEDILGTLYVYSTS